mgnify:CR=1 FL=1
MTDKSGTTLTDAVLRDAPKHPLDLDGKTTLISPAPQLLELCLTLERRVTALQSLLEAAREIQERERWVTAERMINCGGIAGPGNRLASALAKLEAK